MRTVRDETGDRYLLLKESDDACLVRDPKTGERLHLPRDRLQGVSGRPPLETAATGVPESVRCLLGAVHDDRSLGLVIEVVDRDELGVRELLDETTLCESDLHGLLSELVAAGLLAETRVAGGRGYEATETAREAVAQLRVD